MTAVYVRRWVGPQPHGESKLIASATVELEGDLVIERIRVVKLKDGRRLVAMPSVRNTNGSFTDVVRPSNHVMRQVLDDAVLNEVDRVVLA